MQCTASNTFPVRLFRVSLSLGAAFSFCLPEVQENAPMDSSAEKCTYEVQNSAPLRCKKMHPSIRY